MNTRKRQSRVKETTTTNPDPSSSPECHTGAGSRTPSLAGYYIIVIVATTIGITVVFILNLFTPLDFFRNQIAVITGGKPLMSAQVIVGCLLPRFLLILLAAYLSGALAMNRMLRPVAAHLSRLENGAPPDAHLEAAAARRLLRLPFLFAPVNVGMWILIPAAVGVAAVLAGQLPARTAAILAARAGLIGLIASTIASQRMESYSRDHLIPFFFPAGRIADTTGSMRLSISRRLRLLSRLGNAVPMVILLVTLISLQWEVGPSGISAAQYGRGIIVFSTILFVYALIVTGRFNRAVSRNIIGPLEEMTGVLRQVRRGRFDRRVRVVSNDELGQIGDVINEMTAGLRERETLRRSLALAGEIQRSLLPEGPPDIRGLDIAGLSRYCDETGGDYYDFITDGHHGRETVHVAVGDVSGHGISSALLMATTRAFLRQRLSMPGGIGQVVSDVNRQLSRDVRESGSFMTLFLVSVDPGRKSVQWVRAGHDPALLYDPGTGRFSELKGGGIALGLEDTWEYAEKQHNGLAPGCVLVLYTDGIWEAHDGRGDIFGKASLRAVIRRSAGRPAREIAEAVMSAVSAFRGDAAPEDDATLIVLKIAA